MPKAIAHANHQNLVQKHLNEILLVSFAWWAVITFLAISFYLTQTVPAQSIGGGNTPANQPAPAQTQQPSAEQPTPVQAVQISTKQSVPTHLAAARLAPNGSIAITGDNTMWRLTADGWQDISRMVEQEQPTNQIFQDIHPAIWTALMLLAASILVIMVSSDKDVKRLFGRENKSDSQPRTAPPLNPMFPPVAKK
jgi:hypothetical protein